MELLPSENLILIKTLLHSLSTQLHESTSHINSLERLSKDLVPSGQQLTFGNETHSTLDESEKIIQSLEEERLQLVMDIQRQDFITEKLDEVVQQNFEIVNTIKDYIVNSNQVREDEKRMSDLLLDHYIKKSVEESNKRLEVNLEDLKIGMKKIEASLVIISKSMDENGNVVSSKSYDENLKILVQNLNSLIDCQLSTV